MSPEEIVLSNPIIRKEIFKQSSFYGKQTLRLVSREWMIETLAYWRKTTWIPIKIDSTMHKAKDGKYFRWHTPQEFLEIASLEPSEGEDPLVGINKVSLEQYPFRRFKVFGNVFLSKSEGERYENQVTFWNLVGPQVTNLKLEQLKRSNDIWMLHRLLVNTCPNLEQLEIFNKIYRDPKPCTNDDDGTDIWSTDLILLTFLRRNNKNGQGKADDVAHKLHTLKLFGYPMLNEKDSKALIQRCPKLKTLHTRNAMVLEALVFPAANGDFIKLEKLVLKCQSNFEGLTQYIEKFPEVIKVLELNCVPLDLDNETAEGYPHSVYAAIAKCTQLQELKLSNKCANWAGKELKIEPPFFLGLSSFLFQNLTRLQLSFKYMKFDFSCLTRMPALEELTVSCDCTREGMPMESKVFTENEVDIENQVFKKLRKLTMDYPIFSFKDACQLSKWFPNLNFLDVALEAGSEETFLNGFPNLKTLFLHHRGSMREKHLDLVKEKRKIRTLEISYYYFCNIFE